MPRALLRLLAVMQATYSTTTRSLSCAYNSDLETSPGIQTGLVKLLAIPSATLLCSLGSTFILKYAVGAWMVRR